MLTKISVEQAEEKLNRRFTNHNLDLLWTDYEDTNLIVNILKDCRTILELGTYRGHTTENLANNTYSEKITTVDIVKEFHNVLPKFQTHELLSITESGEKIKNSKVFKLIMTTDEFFSSCKDTFDGIFIDASHDYDDVLRDSLNSLKVLKSGGIIVWHDVYNLDNSCSKCLAEPDNPSVVKALENLPVETFKVGKSWIAFYLS